MSSLTVDGCLTCFAEVEKLFGTYSDDFSSSRLLWTGQEVRTSKLDLSLTWCQGKCLSAWKNADLPTDCPDDITTAPFFCEIGLGLTLTLSTFWLCKSGCEKINEWGAASPVAFMPTYSISRGCEDTSFDRETYERNGAVFDSVKDMFLSEFENTNQCYGYPFKAGVLSISYDT